MVFISPELETYAREFSELRVVCLSVRSSISFYIFYTSSELLSEFQQKLTQSMSSCMKEIQNCLNEGFCSFSRVDTVMHVPK